MKWSYERSGYEGRLLVTVAGWVLAECSDRNGGGSNFVQWKFLSIKQQLHGVSHPNVPELHRLTLGGKNAKVTNY